MWIILTWPVGKDLILFKVRMIYFFISHSPISLILNPEVLPENAGDLPAQFH